MKVSTPRVAVGIRAIASHLPSRRLSNSDLVRLGCPTSAEQIERKTGIRVRHVAAEGERLSDLAVAASRCALAHLSPTSVDAVILAGDNLDYGGVRLTSGVVASALAIENASTFDIKMGCPASVAALHLGVGLIAAGLAQRTLLAVGEVNTQGVNWQEIGSVWFGDAAAAALLEPCAQPDFGIIATGMAGTGNGAEVLQVPAGGSAEPTTQQTVANARHRLHHDAHAVFPFAVEAMVTTVRALLRHIGRGIADIDVVVPHQANLRVIEAAASALMLPMEKVALSLQERGNTAAPSVLLTLAEAVSLGRVTTGSLVLTVGFGGGLAWGGQIIRWGGMGSPDSKRTIKRR